MLQLTAGYAARAIKDSSVEWLDEAEQIAARTGETDTLDMAFGPTNVRLWQISIEVDGGDPGRAVEIAATTDTSFVSSPNRLAAYYSDTARALARVKQDQRAVRMLLAAENVAPQQVHASPAAQETARSLLDRGSLRARFGTHSRSQPVGQVVGRPSWVPRTTLDGVDRAHRGRTGFADHPFT
jgi:hypothetical protein